MRHCPDTQGVGRWIANMLGGYALLAFPITMFVSQFYNPIILPIMSGVEFGQTELIYQTTLALLWTIGLPFFVMAYILPIVMFNEAMQSRSTVRILKLARRLGAKMVRKEKIQEIKRLSYAYDVGQKGTVELYAAAKDQEIISTQKSIKAKREKQKKGNTKSNVKKSNVKKKSAPKKKGSSKKATKKKPKKK